MNETYYTKIPGEIDFLFSDISDKYLENLIQDRYNLLKYEYIIFSWKQITYIFHRKVV